MLWPTLCIDDFFKNPEAVITLANSQKFSKGNGTWPGERTEPTYTFSKEFFDTTTKKIVSALYPKEALEPNIRWRAQQFFQKIPGSKNPGFIHTDTGLEFTSIIYLSDYEDAGTAIYRQIKEPIPDHLEPKKKGYLKDENSRDFEKAIKDNRECFQKTLEFTSLKNRMVLFDAQHHHGVENFGKINETRLTLVTFFFSIGTNNGEPLKYHVNDCTRP